MLPPRVDPRTFQDLVDEAKRRIPQYCPEWTDHNVSDPGVTLIELFAWMTDILLYRLNEVPERDFLQLLDLIGARPRPAVPAQAELLFWLTAPVAGKRVIPRGVEIATRQTETSPAIVFTTDADLPILEPKLDYVILARCIAGGAAPRFDFEDISDRLKRDEPLRAEVFQAEPSEEDAFYLGFAENMGGHVIRLNLACEPLRARNVNQEDPPMTWEFWNGEDWAPILPSPDDLAMLRRLEPDVDRLGRRLDDTRGLNRDGRAIFLVPRTATMRELRVGDRALTASWIRCRAGRLREDDRFFDRSPVVNRIAPESLGGVVDASHAFEVVGEMLGRSDGTPSQVLPLLHPPILPRRDDLAAPETLEVAELDGSFAAWSEVESFAGSRPTDSHFLLDSLTGEVQFGPRLRAPSGEERQYGRVPPQGSQIRFTRYRSGGGSVGNVGRGQLIVPRSAAQLSYLKWVANLTAATGGRDQETLEQFKLRGPKLVSTREVAVTRSDFENLAHEASARIARARCVPPSAAGANGSNGQASPNGPATVRLLIVPSVATRDQYVERSELELAPEARRALCRSIKAYLEERCPLTTELAVSLADYRWVSVRAILITRARPDLDDAERERRTTEIRAEAERRLYRFIHPATGGADGEGWPWGKALRPGDVYPLLQEVPEVEFVDLVRFRPVSWIDERAELSADERLLQLAPGEVACSYQHEIVVREG